MARRWVSFVLFRDRLKLMKLDKAEGREGKNPAPHSSILILGVGNILLSDEGVGVRVIEAMRGMILPDNVELLDGGTASMALLDSLGNRDKVIIIDAAKGGNRPGTLYRFTPAEIEAKKHMFASLHEVGLLEALAMDEFLSGAPQNMTIYGIEPKELGWGLELSPEVAAVIPRVIDLILSEL